MDDNQLKPRFEEYERRHFVIRNTAFLSILGCEEAYKIPRLRQQYLDHVTTYQPAVSTDRIAVYHRKVDILDELYICFHGTRLTSIEDIIQDIGVFENTIQSSAITIQYMETAMNIRRAFNFIPDENVYISGHSLGSVYSLLASKIMGVYGYGFNGATAVINFQYFTRDIDVLDRTFDLKDIDTYSRFIAYRIQGDPVSFLSKWVLRNVVNINVEGLGELSPLARHSISTMAKVCIPYVPLKPWNLTPQVEEAQNPRSRIPKEGQEMEALRDSLDSSWVDKLLETGLETSRAINDLGVRGAKAIGNEIGTELRDAGRRVIQVEEMIEEGTRGAFEATGKAIQAVGNEIGNELKGAVDNTVKVGKAIVEAEQFIQKETTEVIEDTADVIEEAFETFGIDTTYANPLNWF